MSDNRNSSRAGASHLTMVDLAKLAGVSTITVSRALADSPRVSPATRQRIQQLARELGYTLNVDARNLRLRRNHALPPGRSRAVAVIVEMTPSPDRAMADPYPLALLGGISQELTSGGYDVLLTTRPGSVDLAARAADGLILLGQGAHADAVLLYERVGLPMVIWGTAALQSDRYIVIGSDNRHGGMSVAERFVSLGRRHPVFIGNPDHPEIAQRLFGFAAELSLHGIKPLVIRHTDFTAKSALQAVRTLHNRGARFDAIFACSDLLAMGAIRALTELGRSVPDAVSLIGYDDIPQAMSFRPPLSTVRQRWLDGGTLLARTMLRLLGGEPAQSQRLPTELVIRAT